jgi:hypothetical protein
MAITIDGNNLIFEGTITLANYSGNGVATLTLTPSGGVGTIPGLVAGDPGLPPILDWVVNTLPAGSSATVSDTVVNAGGPGVASEIQVTLGIPQGATGATSTTISAASDLSGTAVVGDYLSVTGTGPTAFQYAAFPWANGYNATTISSVSTSGASIQTLCSITVPSQPSAYFPLCFARATTVGTANTVINLQATLGSTSGSVLGFDDGLSGVATQKLHMLPAFGGLLTSSYGLVAAGTPATIYFAVQQTNSGTSDAWSVNNGTVSCTVATLPVS